VVGIESKSDHVPPFACSVKTFAKANCPHRTPFNLRFLPATMAVNKSVWYSLLTFVILLKIPGKLTGYFQYTFVFSLFDQAGPIKLQHSFHFVHCDSGIFHQVAEKFLHHSQLLRITYNLVSLNCAARQ